MKKSINRTWLIILAALTMTICLGITAYADNTVYTEGTLYYTIDNESVTITGCFGKKTEIEVPASIAGYPVNTIAKGAFTGNQYLEKLSLPDTVSKIEGGAISDNITVTYNYNTDHPSSDPSDITGKAKGSGAPQDSSANSEADSNAEDPGTKGSGADSSYSSFSDLNDGDTVNLGNKTLTVISSKSGKVKLKDKDGNTYHVEKGNIVDDSTGEVVDVGDAVKEGDADLEELEKESDGADTSGSGSATRLSKPVAMILIVAILAVLAVIGVFLYRIYKGSRHSNKE